MNFVLISLVYLCFSLGVELMKILVSIDELVRNLIVDLDHGSKNGEGCIEICLVIVFKEIIGIDLLNVKAVRVLVQDFVKILNVQAII